MPTYDYVCDACQHAFEEFQSMTEEPLKKCPQCKKKKLRRLLGTGAAIIFKGAGFYQTDYRSESYKSAAKAEESSSKPAPEGAKAGEGSASKTDTSGTSSTGGTSDQGSKSTSKKSKKSES